MRPIRDAAGQQVAQAREQAEALAAAPELDVEPGDRLRSAAPAGARDDEARPGARARPASVSEGLNESVESATAEIRSRRCGPNVIAQGIFSGPAPRATSRSAPSAEPPSGGAPFSLAFSVTGAWPPGLSRTQRGFGTISSPPAPVLRMRTSRVRDETLRITSLLRRVPAVALGVAEREARPGRR